MTGIEQNPCRDPALKRVLLLSLLGVLTLGLAGSLVWRFRNRGVDVLESPAVSPKAV